MTDDEARAILAEALLHVDFVNLGRTVSALGEYGYTWKTFDNSKWRPDKNLALKDVTWLVQHVDQVAEAIKYIRDQKG